MVTLVAMRFLYVVVVAFGVVASASSHPSAHERAFFYEFATDVGVRDMSVHFKDIRSYPNLLKMRKERDDIPLSFLRFDLSLSVLK